MTGFQDIGVRAVVQGLGQYEKDLAKIDSKTKAVGKAVVGALAGAAIGAAVGVLGGRFAKLEQTMAGVSARAGLTAEQTDRLTDSVIRLSRANLQSQEEIALTGEALISLQGVSADNQEQIESLTQKYLDYAQVTGQTAPDAVAAFDDILDAWNLTAEDGVAIMDQLIVSHQKFGTDIPAAQGALNKYASTFQTLGLDINDALGYINLFAASGIDAESSAAAFNKAVGLLTENSDASNKKLAEMATNLGFTNEQFEAFKSADPATQFDILTKAIAATEDPTIRAQAAIDLFGTKAGPKLAEALAGNDLDEFQISLEESAGASELAANKIQGTLINKLKLLGNEITGRAMELTQQFMPALALLGNPQITSAIGGIAGAFAGIKVPDLSEFSSNLQAAVAQGFTSVGNVASGVTQTITQTVSRTPAVAKQLIDDLLDRVQNIRQEITKVTIAPTVEADAEKAGGTLGQSIVKGIGDPVGAFLGGGIVALFQSKITFKAALSVAARAGMVGLAAALIAALGVGIFLALKELGSDTNLALAIVAAIGIAALAAAVLIAALPAWAVIAAVLATALAGLLVANLVVKFWPEISEFFGHTLPDMIVGAVTAFFTPENIGRRLADLVAIALIGIFAPLVLTIHFREEIASMFELLGRLIIEGASALPGLLAGLGTTVGQTIVDVLMTEIQFPLIGGLKVWEIIAGLLLPVPAVIYEFFKQGLADILVNFLETLPALALAGLQKTGEGIGFFFTDILPALLTGEYLPVLATTFVDFFGTTLPNLITVEAPKIPGAVLDALVDLPGLVLNSLGLVTEKVTDWISGLASFVTDTFIPWDWIKTAAGAFVDEIVMWLAAIWGSGIISDWVMNLSSWLTDNFNPWTWVKVAFELMTTEVGKVLDSVVTTVTGLPQRIIDGLGDLTTTLSQKGTDLVGGLASGAESGITALKTRLLGLPSEIGTLFALMVPPPIDWLYERGQDLIEGMIRGALKKITEIPGRVFGKVKSVVDDAGKGFGLWGSPSPWMTERGYDFMQGFTNGAQAGIPGVRDAMAGVVHVVGEGMQGVAGAFAGVVSSGMQGVATAVSGIAPHLREVDGLLESLGIHNEQYAASLSYVANATPTAQSALALLALGYADASNAVLEYVAGLIDYNTMIERVYVSLTEQAEVIGYTLEQYDLLTSSLERAKDNQLDTTDAMYLAQAGFTDLADAVVQYTLGLITADELTQQIQTTFTEVATSAAVLGEQWTTAFADAMGRQDLLEAVGSAGLRVIDQLNLVLTEGGQQNVETLARSVTGLLEELESELPADEAAALGESITLALEKAIRDGTPEAIKAFTDLLADADDAIEAGTTKVLSSVEKFNMQLGDKFADKELQDKVGQGGADLMDALDLAIETGGEQGVETMAKEAFDIIEAMEKELEPGVADYLGTTLMSVLQTALETGGAEAIQAVIDTLAQIQGLIDDAPTTIPTPKAATPPSATPGKSGTQPSGAQPNPALALVDPLAGQAGASMYDGLLRWLTGVGTDSVKQATQYLNGIFGSLKNPWSEVNSKITAWARESADKGHGNPIHAWHGGRKGFHEYLKAHGLAFARGGSFWAARPTMFLAGEAGRERVDVTPFSGASTPAELMTQPGFASSAHARQSMMGTQIQVSPSVSVVIQAIDWNRVRQIARDTVDSAIGQAKSQYDRSDVMLTGGVG